MNKFYYLLAALLLSWPLAGEAQQAPTPAYRYYGGLGIYNSNNQYISGNSVSDLSVPVQVTLGQQLRPRLAVQASVAYSQYTLQYSKFNSTNEITPTYHTANTYVGQSVSRSTTLSLLARYTLTRRTTHRLQVDVLGGATLEKHRSTSAYQHTFTATDSTGTRTTNSFNQQGYAYSLWLLTGGLSARYRLSPHLEAVADATLNARLAGLGDPPTVAGALGLRYRFGQ